MQSKAETLMEKMIEASTKRNALLGIREVLRKEVMRPNSKFHGTNARFGKSMSTQIVEQEQIIMDCYHQLIKRESANG